MPSVRASGMTLIETILAMTLTSTIALLGAQALRITWQAWNLQDQRSDVFQQMHGTLTHITRDIRSARSVVSVSAAADTSGYLSITRPNNNVVKWDHNGTNDRVYFGTDDPPRDLLATGIKQLMFECFTIDGVTPTTVPADVRMIRTTVGITVPGEGVLSTVSSAVWIRLQQDGLAAVYTDFYAKNSSTPGGWVDYANLINAPDGLFSSGAAGASVEAFGFDPTGYSGDLGTVLVGLYLRADDYMGSDFLDVQIDTGSLGPLRSFSEASLARYRNNTRWFWVDVTDDLASSRTYADLGNLRVLITNSDAGAGGTTIRLDSVKVRTFTSAPLIQDYWLAGVGTASNEFGNVPNALGTPDSLDASSRLFSLPSDDVDRQDYVISPSWNDLGTIVRVRLVISGFYMSATVVDDEFHARLPTTSEGAETMGTPAPVTAEQIPITLLNQHIGSANRGTAYLTFTNLESWTWTGLRSRFVRLYGTATGTPEAEINLDAARVEVRYVPPNNAAVVKWEEL